MAAHAVTSAAVSCEPGLDEAVRLHESGQLIQAERIYRRILAANPSDAYALNLLGVVAQSTGQPERAAELIGNAIAIRGDVVAFHTNLGNAVLELGRTVEAVACYRKALSLNPASASALNNLGYALLCQGNRQEAMACCDRALALAPESHEALTNKASVLLELGELEDAAAHYRRALDLKPDYLAARNNLGVSMLDQGRFDEAIEHFNRALRSVPDCPESLLNKSVVQLLHGDFAAGWPNYEHRQRVRRGNARIRTFAQPQWRGEPLHGKRILLHAEQGLGDCIHFLRYLPLVQQVQETQEAQQSGSSILLEVPARLLRLVEGFSGVAKCLAPGDPLPSFDYHCPLLSLPLAFGTRLETIPGHVPYLVVPEDETQRAAALSWPREGLRVGLVWAGTPDHPKDWARSVALARLSPLLAVEGAHFCSLQVGPAAAQLDAATFPITDLAPQPGNLADTAAKILQLDLVITVDTAVAHLAGALAKPVWVMLPTVPDWRWLLHRSDSPWYPTMRLFRQAQRGDWSSVVAEIRAALLQLIQNPPVRAHQPGSGSALAPVFTPSGEPASGQPVSAHPCEPVSASPRCEPAIPQVSDPSAAPCKICGSASPLFGVVDFHKSCMEGKGRRLNLSGIPIYYRRCGACRFVFTDAFDHWSQEAFARTIYNQDYPLVDPDFAQLRPDANAHLIVQSFASSGSTTRILDYGGGSGRLASQLREKGFSAATYDPFSFEHRQLPQGRFDLITCFEVLEHVPQPVETVAAMASLLEDNGVIFFSTLLQPPDFDTVGLNWWYAAPRNGHLSLYSADALLRLFAVAGFRVASCNPALHLAYRHVPPFAAHLLPPA